MKRILPIWLGLLLLGIGCGTQAPVETSTPEPTLTPAPTATPDLTLEGWELMWHDEFDEPEINSEYWSPDVSGRGGGNGEAQEYTDAPENLFTEDGHLVIRALSETSPRIKFTSARLDTRDKVEFTYGRVEARIQIPSGQGLWPAFWLLGANLDRRGWPFNGEIDIMENIGREPDIVHGTVHGPDYSGGNGVGAPFQIFGDDRYADDFHVFAVEWDEDQISWFMDDNEYFRISPASVPGDWVFDHDFFIILNVAVGGEWPGYPDDTTTFPQDMRVDYVRVYQRTN
jgi:beta-glucanase (GH16 family)